METTNLIARAVQRASCSSLKLSEGYVHKTSFTFSVGSTVSVGKGALYISNGTYHELGRTLDEHELIFVRKGRLQVDEPDQSYEVNPGQSMILTAGVHHTCRETGKEPLQQYWVRFMCPEMDGDSKHPTITLPKLATIARPDRMLQLWRMYTDERKDESIGQTTTGLLVALLLCEVAHSGEAAYDSTDTLDVLAAQARAFIQEHFHEPISRASIALALDCNPNYLGRAFRKTYGKTITEYIYDVRLYYAREALAYERTPVGEIARTCGFGDRCHFRQVFVKRQGMSPLAYRKRYGHLDTNL